MPQQETGRHDAEPRQQEDDRRHLEHHPQPQNHRHQKAQIAGDGNRRLELFSYPEQELHRERESDVVAESAAAQKQQ